ncbi:MAG TPA: alpha/beta fold hydrolase [Ktedonobacterales bacterium]|nr:alpha/beta fold hydrolase [Ktedonobacterales bacterium]
MSQSGMAAVNGTRLYYEMAGEGHPLVLIHAGIADSRMWDDQFALFAERYRVVRYDLRGFGKSEVPPGPYALRDDLYGLLDFLDIQKAYVIGVSMGGGLAIDFTLEHPDMVGALIPVCAGLGGFEPSATETEIAYREAIEAAEHAGDIERVNDMEVHLWVDGLGRTPEQVSTRVRQRVLVMNGLALAREAEQDQAQPQRLHQPAVGRLAEIRVPTLVIIGDQDLSRIQQTADKLASDITGARKVVIRDTAHVPNMERPDEFNHVVLEFLGSVN